MKLKTLLIALCAVGFLLPTGAQAGELDAAVQLAKEYAMKTIADPNFVQLCMGFPEKPKVCNAADAPGNGLVCPGPGKAVNKDHVCTLINQGQLKAALGAKATQLLDLAGEYTVHFSMVGKETSIPRHIHTPDCSGGNCSTKYILRQDEVKVVFAAFQKGSITVSPPGSIGDLTGFKATVTASKSEYFEIGPYHYCQEVDHGDPTSCGEKPVCTGEDCQGTGNGEPGGGDGGNPDGGQGNPDSGNGDPDATVSCEVDGQVISVPFPN